MARYTWIAILGTFCLGACAEQATSIHLDSTALTAMPTGRPMRPPAQYLAFCEREPDECRPGPAITYSRDSTRAERLAELAVVNLEVNAALRWAPDTMLYGAADVWATANDRGDCEDVALTKRKRLREMGWPHDALRLALVLRPPLRMHAVLVILTPEGDVVLDSLINRPLPWQAAPYTWFAREGVIPEQWELLVGTEIREATHPRPTKRTTGGNQAGSAQDYRLDRVWVRWRGSTTEGAE